MHRRSPAEARTLRGSLIAISRDYRARQVPLGILTDRLGEHGLGLMLLVLTLPSLIPVPGPFGMVFGTLIAVIALQRGLGSATLQLPGPLQRVRVPG